MPSTALPQFRFGSIAVARAAGVQRARHACVLLSMLCAGSAGATQLDINGPAGSVQFGRQVAVLPNGNIVVTDPEFDGARGAVYLYSPTGAQISALIGDSADDHVGGRIVVLSNGNYVIVSPQWDGDAAPDAGAVTWGSATTGVSGAVTAANSLVGTSTNDGFDGVTATALTNGNYVVSFSGWDNGPTVNAGAVVWCNGSTGRIGPVTTTIALYGTTDEDLVGRGKLGVLSNGNYVVLSGVWNNGPATGAGAVTWGNGTGGTTGPVSALNSLVGSTADDNIGGRLTFLTNGNYVVRSTRWDNGLIPDAGAATWGNGAGGTIGPITPLNSLVGSAENDSVGGNAIALSNGNYVVSSELWDNGLVQDAGAATFSSGTGGTVGPITEDNSLIGDGTEDFVGSIVVALTNGNYVVLSPSWDDDATLDVGAVTRGNGTSGIAGVVSTANSLIGDTQYDAIGNNGAVALSNGNYVVSSPTWDGPLAGQEDAGAVTFAPGSGLIGVVSPANSLIGSTQGDNVGDQVVALTNGNYAVASMNWDNPGTIDVGAVTWGNGTGGTIDAVSPANSLIGGSESDRVGRLLALANGSYVVGTLFWNAGGGILTGAATWCSGTGPTSAVVSASNSLVGSSPNDAVGEFANSGKDLQAPPADGAYVLITGQYDDVSDPMNPLEDAGAVSLGYGNGNPTGPVNAKNSVIGATALGGSLLSPAYDDKRGTLVVGLSASNKVTLFNQKVFVDGFEAP